MLALNWALAVRVASSTSSRLATRRAGVRKLHTMANSFEAEMAKGLRQYRLQSQGHIVELRIRIDRRAHHRPVDDRFAWRSLCLLHRFSKIRAPVLSNPLHSSSVVPSGYHL